MQHGSNFGFGENCIHDIYMLASPSLRLRCFNEKHEKSGKKRKKQINRSYSSYAQNSREIVEGSSIKSPKFIDRTLGLGKRKKRPALNKREDAAHTTTCTRQTTNLYNRSSLLLSIHLCVSARLRTRNWSQRRQRRSLSESAVIRESNMTRMTQIRNNDSCNNNSRYNTVFARRGRWKSGREWVSRI